MLRRQVTIVAVAVVVVVSALRSTGVDALVPFLDGGKGMPKLYNGWMDEQIAKQARTAVSKAVAAGKTKIEVNFPPVPNVEEVRFGTPLNQKFGRQVVAKDLAVQGGYRPGSELSRQLIAYSNVYWAVSLKKCHGGRVMVLYICVCKRDCEHCTRISNQSITSCTK
jgi:hypothetical protein